MTELDAASRPRLARGVRLRLDRLTGKTLLLRPEQGFELQGSALEIVKLCQGDLSIAEIVERLASLHQDAPRAQLAADVTRLLTDLTSRGLLTVEVS